MPDSSELLAVARLLASYDAAPLGHAGLRRAVSTAYYALFHHVLRAGAERFAGRGSEASAGYALLYRAFNHGRMRAVCQALNVAKLGSALERQLGRGAASEHVRTFAASFVALQDARHLADYDPAVMFERAEASAFVDAARDAMAAFDRADPDERADVLALMLVNPRG